MSKRIKILQDIIPFHYVCFECDARCSFVGDPFLDEKLIYKPFENWIDVNYLDKIDIFKDDEKSKRVIASLLSDESTAIIVKLPGKCNKCGTEIIFDVWIKLTVRRKDRDQIEINVDKYVILDGDFVGVSCIPGFYRGVDIASGLHDLYLRWWFLQGDIYVFCPFIQGREFQFFDGIGKDIRMTYHSIIEENNQTQPFKMIIVRERSQGKAEKIKDQINKYLEGGEREFDFMPENPGSGLLFVFRDSLYGVTINSPKDKEPANYKTYFHAKMYGALTLSGAEMVITSYNYVPYETMQLESVSFAEVEEELFLRQVAKFTDDPHMKIEKIDLADI